MNIVIIGATSTIAKEFARIASKASETSFVLIGRNDEKLSFIASDLRTRGSKNVYTLVCDLDNISSYPLLLEKTIGFVSRIDLLLIAHGTLPDQNQIIHSPTGISTALHNNFVSHSALLANFSSFFENQKSGSIAVISSVAGDRGRKSNFIYGSAKAGMQVFLEGYGAYMGQFGVHVMDIRPGMVETQMTQHLKKGLLFASPLKVANDIYRGFLKKRDVIYTPFYWMGIMAIIKRIPRAIMKKLNF